MQLLRRFKQVDAEIGKELVSNHVATLSKVGVVGLGLMGHGVVQVAAQAGYNVIGLESNNDALDRGDKRIEDSLKKMIAKDVKKGKLTEVRGYLINRRNMPLPPKILPSVFVTTC